MNCFLHIPKCGGTSMVEVLSQVYGHYVGAPAPGKLWWIHGLYAAEQYLQSIHLGQPACIAGHISYSFTEFLPEDSRVFTMLRHPVDRVISLFYHKLGLQGGGKKRWYEMGFTDETTLREWVESGIDPGLDNAMTAQLAGMPVDKEMQPLYPVQSYHLRQAIENIGEMAAVGILEEFRKSVEMFGDVLEWSVRPELRHENSREHPGRDEISTEVLRRIVDRNKYDLVLYDVAKERLGVE